MSLDQDTLHQLLDTIRRFVRNRLMPLEEQVASTDQIPESVISEMRELGLFGLTIPEEYGGLCLLYTSPSPRDVCSSRMPSSA